MLGFSPSSHSFEMYSVAHFGPRIFQGFSSSCIVTRISFIRLFSSDNFKNGLGHIEDFLNESWKNSSLEYYAEEEPMLLDESFGSFGVGSKHECHSTQNLSAKQSFISNVRSDARRILDILYQDGPGFNGKTALDNLNIQVSGLLVREVLFDILKTVNYMNKNRCAKLGYKFFVWAGEQEKYRHTTNTYHLMMKIFAETEEFKAMWRLVDEMTEKGYPITPRTFNILICTCGEAGVARKAVVKFIKSKTFNYRPFKDSFDAILHSLIAISQYELVEWVYQQMLVEGKSPDVLTYNIILCAKLRLRKLSDFHRLLDEMDRSGCSPDTHTFNLLLHVIGKGNDIQAALKLLNYMKEVGVCPTVLHFTTLIDGLSRAGNLEACQYFFSEMINHGCMPDVVCYTVMITGYALAGEMDKAQELLTEMISRGQLPNVFTYNSMIRGLCMARKFSEALVMLKEMETKGCNPNFLVYSTIVGYLRNAGKLSEAREVIKHMVEKGKYVNLLSKINKRYRRC